MFDKLTGTLDFHGKALVLRAERQRTIASNIANADTPGYAARDFDFKAALAEATGARQTPPPTASSPSHPRHLPLAAREASLGSHLGYAVQTQPALDNNSVDLDRERAAFVDNAVRYEATLRFMNGYSRTILSAITGQ